MDLYLTELVPGKAIELNDYVNELSCDIRPTIQTCLSALEYGEETAAATEALGACLVRWNAFDRIIEKNAAHQEEPG